MRHYLQDTLACVKNHVIAAGAYWRHLANTTKLSVCGSHVAFCQITPTTYYYYYKCKKYSDLCHEKNCCVAPYKIADSHMCVATCISATRSTITKQ